MFPAHDLIREGKKKRRKLKKKKGKIGNIAFQKFRLECLLAKKDQVLGTLAVGIGGYKLKFSCTLLPPRVDPDLSHSQLLTIDLLVFPGVLTRLLPYTFPNPTIISSCQVHTPKLLPLPLADTGFKTLRLTKFLSKGTIGGHFQAALTK